MKQKIQEKLNTCNSVGNPSLYHYIWNVAFCVTRYLKRGNETPTSIKICIGLIDAALQPQILGNKLDIPT